MLVAVAALIDHLSNQRRRAITQQMHGEKVRFAETRIVELGEERVKVTVAGEFDGPMTVTFGGKGTGEKERRIELSSPWWFGDPVWEGTVDGSPVAVQVRPILMARSSLIRVEQTRVSPNQTALMRPCREGGTRHVEILLCPMPVWWCRWRWLRP